MAVIQKQIETWLYGSNTKTDRDLKLFGSNTITENWLYGSKTKQTRYMAIIQTR
jgi:hypothetical protein